jgi:hypothetical protein
VKKAVGSVEGGRATGVPPDLICANQDSSLRGDATSERKKEAG